MIFSKSVNNFFTNYNMVVLPEKKGSCHCGVTKYTKLFGEWKFYTKIVNGRLHSIGLQRDHKVDFLDCLAHLERKRIRRNH